MLYRTVTEYDTAISEAQAAIKRIVLLGAETENDSGGSSRAMKEADFKSMQSWLALLQNERKILNGDIDSVPIIGLGW